MFLKRLEPTVPDVKPIKLIRFRCIKLESGEHWLRANATTKGKRKAMEGKNTPYNGSSPKLLKSRL